MSATVEPISDAINDVTAALDNANISDNSAHEQKVPSDEIKDAVIASAAEGRRLYIGNLAYATTEGELQSFFTGYSIESTSIPKNPRSDRPVGYAFVDLSTPSEAERAITELSGKEILDRKVSVQLARKPEQNVDKLNVIGVDGVSGGEGEGGRRRAAGRGRARGRARSGKAARNNQTPNENGAEATNGKVGSPTEANDSQPATKPKEPKEKTPRPPRERHERGPPADGIPSKTKVMVANLPYDLSEDKLKELFAEYEPVSAKIALRPIPHFMVRKLLARNEPRKGRGFGFVTLASHELQDKAVAEMNGKEVEGREIAVKIAIDSPDKIPDQAPALSAQIANDSTNGVTETEGNNCNPETECPNGTVETKEINGIETTEVAG